MYHFVLSRARRDKDYMLDLVSAAVGLPGAWITGSFAIGKVMDDPSFRIRPGHQAVWLIVGAILAFAGTILKVGQKTLAVEK